MMTALRQLNLFQKFLRQFPTFRSRNTSVNQGQLDVLKCIEFGQEKELLKDKADLLIADLGQLFLSKTCHFLTILVLAAFFGKAVAPKADGINYIKSK